MLCAHLKTIIIVTDCCYSELLKKAKYIVYCGVMCTNIYSQLLAARPTPTTLVTAAHLPRGSPTVSDAVLDALSVILYIYISFGKQHSLRDLKYCHFD